MSATHVRVDRINPDTDKERLIVLRYMIEDDQRWGEYLGLDAEWHPFETYATLSQDSLFVPNKQYVL